MAPRGRTPYTAAMEWTNILQDVADLRETLLRMQQLIDGQQNTREAIQQTLGMTYELGWRMSNIQARLIMTGFAEIPEGKQYQEELDQVKHYILQMCHHSQPTVEKG